MFTCPTCNQDCKRLIAREEDVKLRCELCYNDERVRPSYLHEYISGTDNKITRAKWDVIGHRGKSRDDNATIIDMRTGRETQY